jgi:putative tryptophan/tyrosine transport system substrate-binding protein
MNPSGAHQMAIGRRQFIGALGGATAVWPLAARAQQPAMPVIGFLNSASSGPSAHLVAAFREGLNEVGYVEDRNVTIEYRWAEGQIDRLPALAAELVQRQVAVIVTSGGDVSARAAKAATSSIPIVSTIGGDPVKEGLVASFNRPGGNLTGATLFAYSAAKRLELLHELIPKAVTIMALFDPSDPVVVLDRESLQAASQTLGLHLRFANAGTVNELEVAFETIDRDRPDGLFVGANPFFNRRFDQLVGLAARHTIPTICAFREFPAAGGLISYGTRLADTYRQVGIYTGRIIKGESPADLPVVQPTKFELVINLKTAKSLGIEVPPTLLATADEVIE